MKKSIVVLFVLLLFAFTLTSCGGICTYGLMAKVKICDENGKPFTEEDRKRFSIVNDTDGSELWSCLSYLLNDSSTDKQDMSELTVQFDYFKRLPKDREVKEKLNRSVINIKDSEGRYKTYRIEFNDRLEYTYYPKVSEYIVDDVIDVNLELKELPKNN